MALNSVNINHPEWVKVRYRQSDMIDDVERFLSTKKVNTVCSSALCPNRSECFNQRAMTFLILGPKCTRHCTFCSVDKSASAGYSDFEKDSDKILDAVKKFKLRYVTLTSPTRDDIPDGGASVYSDLILKLHNLENPPLVEVLVPDFDGNPKALETVLKANPEVLAHNLETVPRLYYGIRKGADWARSIKIIKRTAEYGKSIPKSAFMVGLGETLDELFTAMRSAHDSGCKIMVIGQYLRSTKQQSPVNKYYSPGEFALIEKEGKKIGFKVILSGPLYRSSYLAEQAYHSLEVIDEESYI